MRQTAAPIAPQATVDHLATIAAIARRLIACARGLTPAERDDLSFIINQLGPEPAGDPLQEYETWALIDDALALQGAPTEVYLRARISANTPRFFTSPVPVRDRLFRYLLQQTTDENVGATLQIDHADRHLICQWGTEGPIRFPVQPLLKRREQAQATRALIVSDDAAVRSGVAARLGSMGIATTTDFETGDIDLCLVADPAGSTYHSLTHRLPGSCVKVDLAGTAETEGELTRQLVPLTQVGLRALLAELREPAPTPVRVLAVDDNPMNLSLLQRQLTDLGAQVDTATSAEAALREACDVDLVLLDLHLPDASAIDVTKALGEQAQTPRIVGLTAHASPGEVSELIAAGMEQVLIKPARLDTLRAVLTDAPAPRPPKPAPRSATAPVVFNLEMALAAANGRSALAAELAETLIKTLPADIEEIVGLLKDGDVSAALRASHRLHGALAYCGYPALKDVVAQLERLLSAPDTSTQAIVLRGQLEVAADRVLEHHRDHPGVFSPTTNATA